MKNDDREIIQNLIEVLLDPDAREDEIDDAAIDLGDFDDDSALDALILLPVNQAKTKRVFA